MAAPIRARETNRVLGDVLSDLIAVAAEFIFEPVCYLAGCGLGALLELKLEYDGYVLLGFVSLFGGGGHGWNHLVLCLI